MSKNLRHQSGSHLLIRKQEFAPNIYYHPVLASVIYDSANVECPEEGQSPTLSEIGAILRFICGDVKNGSFTFRVASDNHDGLYQDFLARLEEADT